jgi:hypothetical protein
MKKLLISSSLVFISVFSFSQAKWNCGVNGAANVVAVFDAATQTLVVSGKGKMGDGVPWGGLREAIKIVKINQGVTTIAEKAFGGSWLDKQFYPNLETVFISNTVTEIGSFAFGGATGLRKIDIPNSIVKIDNNAFSKSGLESISLPYSVKYIGSSAFSDCKSLKTANLNNTQIPDIGALFDGCEQLEDVYLPKKVVDIGWRTFYKCSLLKSITCYNSTPPNIGINAFSEFMLGNGERLDISKLTLYVPEASIGVYKYSDGWKNFSEIKAISAR